MKTTIKNIFLFITVVFISILYYKKYHYNKVIESLAVADNNKLTSADRWKQSITKLLKDLNYSVSERNNMMLKEPQYFFNKMEELNNKYLIALKRNREDYVTAKLNPRNNNLQRKYESSTNDLNGIQGDFHSLASDFVVDAKKLETFINKYDDKIQDLMQVNQERSSRLESLQGSNVTARQMYTDYKSVYKMSYLTIMLTIISVFVFFFLIYIQLKSKPSAPGPNGVVEPFMKKYIMTSALAILFAVVFSFVYNAVVDFINKQRGKETRESRGEISVADIPSYSFKFQIIDKTQEQDEPDETDYIRS